MATPTAAIAAALDDAPAMTSVSVSNLLGPEYLPMVHDVVRMVAIQLTIQLMVYLSSPGGGLFTQDFVMLVVYIVLGVMFYWLVIRKLVAFT
jgi:hypothetical protein